ncbi:hypothetical protein HPB48_001372 [Haemaphysalis longicornis]|uniref:DDE Tnp4 domain-containing protein n=1 Tax=Haemaphysalis longicornis TaxID=44386 RepID=A0A9J6F798_HAELO|nr:hypothetical protein HPB48_001372 [Haemaphysalis longicornis]
MLSKARAERFLFLGQTCHIFSPCRRCVENAFGITAAMWRILLRTIHLHPDNVDFVIKAACILHNFLTVLNKPAHVDTEDQFGNVVAGCWRQNIQRVQVDDGEPHFFDLETTQARNYNLNAAAVRDLFTAYTCSPDGEVPW